MCVRVKYVCMVCTCYSLFVCVCAHVCMYVCVCVVSICAACVYMTGILHDLDVGVTMRARGDLLIQKCRRCP